MKLPDFKKEKEDMEQDKKLVELIELVESGKTLRMVSLKGFFHINLRNGCITNEIEFFVYFRVFRGLLNWEEEVKICR